MAEPVQDQVHHPALVAHKQRRAADTQLELKTNTELTRSIHQLTQEIHRRLLP